MTATILIALAFAGISYARVTKLIPGYRTFGGPFLWAFVLTNEAFVLQYDNTYLAAIFAIAFAGLLIWITGPIRTKSIVITRLLNGLYILPLFFMFDQLLIGILLGFVVQGVVYALPQKYAEPIFAAIIGATLSCKLLAGF